MAYPLAYSGFSPLLLLIYTSTTPFRIIFVHMLKCVNVYRNVLYVQCPLRSFANIYNIYVCIIQGEPKNAELT